MRILGVGFPRGAAIPTNVSACGDGIHTFAARWGQTADCVCDRMTIDLSEYRRPPHPVRVVLVDASMDGTAAGEIRRVTGRMVAG